jgi:2-methylisocitrate lyase-like PEP mutase family enzyme
MDVTHQRDRGAALRALHGGKRILVLPNAWDVASARLIEQAGFPAIATTSAGVAFALGYPDGERIPRSEMVAAVARIAAGVRIPVTADMEAGYGPRPDDVAATVREVIAAGAVGMNLEDGDPVRGGVFALKVAGERVRAARAAADATGIPFVLNARTDLFLDQIGEPETRLERAVERLRAYRAAGADCLFAPGVSDIPTITALVRDAGGLLNILGGAAAPPIPELQRLGVARVSLGSGPMRASLGVLRRITEELKTAGTYRTVTDGAPNHRELNQLFDRKP